MAAAGTGSRTAAGSDEFEISRVFAAPRGLVFRAWTEPARLAKWWGPKGFTNPVCEVDPRPGGKWRVTMRGEDGSEYPITGEVREVAAPERLVMTMDLSEHPGDFHETIRKATGATGPNPAGVMVMTALFEDVGGKTRLTVRVRLASAALREAMVGMGMNEGWSQSLDRLGELLARG